jgi:DNA-binding response OmpR family regulator
MASFNKPGRSDRPPILTGLNILVAEDDFVIAEYVRTVIESAGANVIGPAADVERACALARTEDLHGAVLDLQLRDSIAEPLMNELDSRRVPFVVISGHELSSVPRRIAGMSYVAKPIADAELIEKVAASSKAKSPSVR